MDDSCMAHKAKKKVIEEKIRSKTVEYNQHKATLMRLPAMKKEADAAQKRLVEIEEAEKAAQAAEQQATETAVEAYTEESRWEGATDYSQSCSSSSGDLGCGGGVE
jgi:phage protein D